MKKGFVIFLAVILTSLSTNAQRWKLKRFEAIAGLGVANVFGDVGGASERETLMGMKDYKIKDSRPSLYLGFRFRLTEFQSLKLNFINGFGASNDEGAINDSRGYAFSTFLFEPSLQYEYYFLSEDRNTKSSAMFSRRGMVNTFSMISLYGFTGFGGVLYTPKFTYDSLVTSAEKEFVKNETGFSPVIPLGIGIKYVISSELSLNLELGRRFTFTDYLDGLSTVFSNSNDVYYFGTLSVVYKLTTTRRGIPIIFEGGRNQGRSQARPSRGRKPVGM